MKPVLHNGWAPGPVWIKCACGVVFLGAKNATTCARCAHKLEDPPAVVNDDTELLRQCLEALEGGVVLANCFFDRDGKDGSNNDNYCRMVDVMKELKVRLGKE